MLDSSKLKEFADDNFKFDENGRKLSKRVENTVGKGEIARYEQFLLFARCFQKASFPGASKGVNVWEWVKSVFLANSGISPFVDQCFHIFVYANELTLNNLPKYFSPTLFSVLSVRALPLFIFYQYSDKNNFVYFFTKTRGP